MIHFLVKTKPPLRVTADIQRPKTSLAFSDLRQIITSTLSARAMFSLLLFSVVLFHFPVITFSFTSQKRTQ